MKNSCPAVIEQRLRVMPRILAALALTGSFALASPAFASDEAAAEALFQAGITLMKQKQYAEACPKIEASYKLDPQIGTLLNLADCHEKQGLLAQAWSEWGQARDKAKREGDTARVDLASRKQAALSPRLPRIIVNIQGDLDGLAVFRDKTNLDPASFGVALPVDPGPHSITIRRGEVVLKETTIESKEKATDTVTLDTTDIPPPSAAGPTTDPSPDKKREKPVYVRKNPAMFGGGIAMAIVGGIATPVGIIAIAGTNGNPGAWVTLLGGVGLLGGGVAMAVIGGEKVKKKQQSAEIPTLMIGPTSVTLHMKF